MSALTRMRIDEFATMKYGKMPPKNVVTDSGYPIYSGYRITGYAKEFLYKNPELIVVARGVGGTGDVKISPPEAWITNLSIVLSLSPEIVDKKFLYYRLGREPLKEKLNTGAAQAQITIENLRSYEIELPGIAAQKRIASILSAYDDLIENNQRRIALLEEVARLLYREWFVHFRFPGHEHVKIVDGVPDGWGQLALEELLVLQRGFDLPVASRKDGNVPVYGSTGIVGYHDVAKVKAPMLITGRSGTLGKVAFVSIPCWPLNTALWVKEFRCISPWFGYFLLSELGLEKFNGGASVPTLDRKVVHRLLVARPTDQLLNAFDDQVKASFEMIDKLNYQNQQLSEARDLLLPRLMDGRLEV